ncbi:Afadin and alpha-actinin-binding-domain-containing protein [Triangularia verruculosa]|uniref:Afadin and alpha-actinin-binding-domain-containing protein n=1 Tax=Triangularia verruculosa TaxID=2587418 RepID=A0AAN6XJ85_9PEZI|nr:Afadin and alpha-actinin-binding-domain-containing protein [Triangularia verruculosa]
MIVSENLRTASLYINNQLLSRGLLRDGQNIDFTNPGESEEEMGETMSRIMAVVNDLILRRDRDAEHRESLSATLRTLRAESLRQANDIQRLQEKNAEAQRKAGLSDAAETALRAHVKTAEATIHRLKEEAARTKLLAAQTRSACATEVRKRDRQIEGLKRAVTEAARARGASKSPGVTAITVVGDIGSDSTIDQQGNPLPPTPTTTASSSDGYDLRQETNSFLAELAKGLSEENEGLLTLIGRTTQQLKDMSGWDAGMVDNDGYALSLPTGYEDMAAEIEAVLEHLRTILTNPSFVPIEEVVVREDEINRLRDGWEKMETRWKEAVHLIDGWRRRMQASGRPVNVEELKMGLRLSPVKVQNVEETAQGGLGLRLEAVEENHDDYHYDQADFVQDEGPLELVPEGGMDDQDDSDTSSVFDDQNVDIDELDVEEPNVEILQQSVALPSPPVSSAPQLSPLREHFSAGNKGGRDGPNLRRRPKFAEENVRSRPVSEESPLPPPHSDRPQQSPSRKPLLSVRTVPPEDGGAAAQPASAAVSTPDTSISMDSMSVPKSKSTTEPKSAVTKTSAPAPPPHATKTTKKPSPAPRPVREARKPPSRQQDLEEKKTSTTSATTTRQQQQQQESEARQKKVTSRPPVTRPTRPPITRGRSETRKGDGDAAKPSKPTPRNNSATSTTSTRSAPVTSSAKTSIPSKTSIPPNPEPTTDRSPRRVNSRLPLPRNAGSNGSNASACATASATDNAPVLQPPQSPTQAQQSPLSMATIQAKLVASERDADAARVRAKLKAARKGIHLPAPRSGLVTAENSMPNTPTETMSNRSEQSDYIQYQQDQYDDGEDELGMSAVQPHQVIHAEKPRKRERNVGDLVTTRKTSNRVASRRRSTLNPWELETLIKGGNAE